MKVEIETFLFGSTGFLDNKLSFICITCTGSIAGSRNSIATNMSNKVTKNRSISIIQ